MSEEKTSDQPREHQPTPEEITKRKAEMIAFYKDQNEFLAPQLQYEQNLADIEAARLKRMESILRQAHIVQSQKEQPKTKENGPDNIKED